MHKLITGLALSTVALCSTSIYLWIELRDARSQVASLKLEQITAPIPASRATHPRDDADLPAERGATPDTSRTTLPRAGTTTRQQVYEEDFRDSARRKLAQLSDPTMRAQMFEEWKEANLPNRSKYARYLGISEDDAERLIDVLADDYLAQSEAYARCTLKPPCDYQAVSRETTASKQLALTNLLGAEKQQLFEQYTYTNVERQLMSQFLNNKMPAGSQLSEEQSEQFVAALAGERKTIEMEIKQRGLEPFSYPMEGVAFTFASSPFEPGSSGDRLKEAADYNRRIHARAMAILTSKQLAAFEQMQEAAIVGLKFWLRQQERDLATRTTPSGD